MKAQTNDEKSILLHFFWMWENLKWKNYKTRLPIFVREAVGKMKTFLFQKNTFFIIFSNFSNFKNSLIFCQKNLLSEAQKRFSRKNIILYAIYSKFAPFIDLEKNSGFSSKNTPISPKVINFWTFLEFLLFQSNLTAKLLQIGRKKISRSVAWTKLPICRERSWKTSGRIKRH